MFQKNRNTGHGSKYFCICWDILKNNAVVIAYGKYVMFKIEGA